MIAAFLQRSASVSSSLSRSIWRARKRMESGKGKWKRNVMIKARERWQWIGSRAKIIPFSFSPSKPSGVDHNHNWTENNKFPVAPKGYFPVYVGDHKQKQRFVMKTELANHPLIQKLLEEAEVEYGYSYDGPVSLPCQVDAFYGVLAEILTESGREQENYCSPLCASFSSDGEMAGVMASTVACSVRLGWLR